MSRRYPNENAALKAENRRLHRENAGLKRQRQRDAGRARAQIAKLRGENQRLRERVRSLTGELWGRQSERHVPKPAPASASAVPPKPIALTKLSAAPPPQRKGPKRFDAALPRVYLQVPDPAPEKRVCPVSGEPMKPGKMEHIEVLACRPAEYYVMHLSRTMWVSDQKSAPVYSAWPDDIVSRSRAHTSLLAHVAGEHYAMHQPYHRLEKHAARLGVRLPRSVQVSLMKQVDETVFPLVKLIKSDVLGDDYLHLDATPIALCDPARPGATRESTVWAYRSRRGAVWYQHEESKSPIHPDRELKAAGFSGRLQVDGAAGLNQIGTKGKVTALGCLAHCRRYFYKAYKGGNRHAEPYLTDINRLFRIDRLAQYFKLKPKNKKILRRRHSLPLFKALVARAHAAKARGRIPPKSPLGKAIKYLLEQRLYLQRCITIEDAELSNNNVERCVRPLKIGAKNWLQIGHPKAGPRLANLFTAIENCRQAGVDPETYLADILPRLASHPARRLAELLPAAWKRAREAAKKVADPPAKAA